MGTDSDWQAWGERDPYFGVLTQERFRYENLTPGSFDEFFRMGREEASQVLADCRRHVGEVSTRCTLDFGCGVGRMLIPFSQISEMCVGVDISQAMRAEAARNCSKFNCRNVQLVSSLEEARKKQETFTFVHSYIVLQHINPQRGLGILAGLLASLEKGGCAALQVTYAHSKHRDNFGAPPFSRRLMRRIRRPFSLLSRRIRGSEPKMQMNTYDMNRVLFLAQAFGVRTGGFSFTNHYGHLGMILYLKRDGDVGARGNPSDEDTGARPEKGPT
ncbi:MAG TPA: class I SAM-dependent methyltransferase [Steroidobacteraceae bacterium]|jgi:SAM-dependent methyltransferase